MGQIPVAKPTPIPPWRFPRRGMAVAFLLAATLATVVVLAAVTWPRGEKVDTITGPHWVRVADVSDLPVAQPVVVTEHRIFLVKLESGEILALSRNSPHLGCTVPWNPSFELMGAQGWFRNPCHNDTYDLTGHCFYGPCPRGLDRYETRVVGDDVDVRIGEGALILGPPVDFEAEPVVPRRARPTER